MKAPLFFHLFVNYCCIKSVNKWVCLSNCFVEIIERSASTKDSKRKKKNQAAEKWKQAFHSDVWNLLCLFYLIEERGHAFRTPASGSAIDFAGPQQVNPQSWENPRTIYYVVKRISHFDSHQASSAHSLFLCLSLQSSGSSLHTQLLGFMAMVRVCIACLLCHV